MTTTCQLCGLPIERRQIGHRTDGTPVEEWCHALLPTLPRPSYHCPTGGTGRLDNPSRRHQPAEPTDG